VEPDEKIELGGEIGPVGKMEPAERPEPQAKTEPDGKVEPEAKTELDEKIARLTRANELEVQGEFRGAISACEAALDGSELPDHFFTLARNYFNLAHRGDETFAWRAAFAAIEGIDRRAKEEGRADAQFAVGIVKWVLDHFADWHRQDVPLSYRLGWEIDERRRQEVDSFMRTRYEEYGRMLRSADPMATANRLYRFSPFIVRQGREAPGIEHEARFAMANQFSQLRGVNAAEFIDGLDLPVPGGFNFQSYDRYLLTASRMELERVQARARAVPAIVIASMPKSGSEFLCYSIAETMGAPIARASIGDPLLGVIVESWMREIARGGCVLHDHFSGRPENLAALRACGMEEIHVLVRDPRAVAFSLRNMELELGAAVESQEETPADFFENFGNTVRVISRWLESWLDAGDHGVKVQLVRFRDLVERPFDVMSAILARSGATGFEEKLGETLAKRGRGSNFRKGDDNAWRRDAPPLAALQAWRGMGPRVQEMLGLEP